MENNQKTAAQQGQQNPQEQGQQHKQEQKQGQEQKQPKKQSRKPENADALRQSELYPGQEGFTPPEPVAVGGVCLAEEPIEYNTGRRTVKIEVANTGDRPIQVGSHFHFFEVNRYLEFDRDAAFGFHLNIPATTAVRFEPGDRKEVVLVAYSGKRRIVGFNSLVMGYAGDEDTPGYFPARMKALRRVRKKGFKTTSQSSEDAQKNEEKQ